MELKMHALRAAPDSVTSIVRRRGRTIGRARAGWILGTAAVAGLLGLCYLRFGAAVSVNSDGAGFAIQAWDMLHGNLLLHGWVLSDVSFYTTELPQYMLIEMTKGLSPAVIHVAAAMTYTSVLLLAAVLAKGGATGREGVVRAVIAAGIMFAPQVSAGRVLMAQPEHIGTSVPILAALLLLDRSRRRWQVPVIVCLLLAWALIADQLVAIAIIVPLIVVGGLRAYRELVPAGGEQPDGRLASPRLAGLSGRLQWARYDLALVAAGMIALIVAHGAVAVIIAHGGYAKAPLSTAVVSATQMPGQVWTGVESLLLLFGADPFGLPLSATLLLALLHLAGVGLAVWAVARGTRRFLADQDLVNQLLVTGIAIVITAFLFGWRLRGTFSAHEISVVLPMAAVLAGRLLARTLICSRALPALVLVLAGYGAGLGHDATLPPVAAQNASLATWLTAHHLRDGLAPYWQADSLTLDSGGSRTLTPVITNGKILVPYRWEAETSWYDPRQHYANFVVTVRKPRVQSWPATPAEAEASFGAPERTYRYGDYVIQVWPENLLTRLHH
jgi:hypothetical protein